MKFGVENNIISSRGHEGFKFQAHFFDFKYLSNFACEVCMVV